VRTGVAPMNSEMKTRWQLSDGDLSVRHAELVEMLEDITRLTSDWVWSLDRNFTLSFISDRIFDSCGIPSDRVIGQKLTDIGRFRTANGEIMVPDLNKPFRDLAFEIEARDGSLRHLLMSGIPVYARDTGAFVGVRGIGRDITERRAAEMASMVLAAAIEEIPDAFCICDSNDHFVLFNRSFREINEEVSDTIRRGAPFRGFLDALVSRGLITDAVGREDEWLDARMARHRRPEAAFEIKRQQGRCFLVQEARLPDGSTATMATDITPRIHMEHALKESLRRQQSFMADVAHQLRTPLAVLNANIDTIEDAAAAESLKSDANALSRMVEGLLAETKVDDLEIGTDERADLPRLARSVAAELGALAIKSKRSIEVIAPDNAVWVWGSTPALQQALRILVENALDHTAAGTMVTIEVTAEPAIRVIDRGAGIPDELKPRIFMLGLRADQRGEGVRQGLTAVRRIADAHGAEVGVFDGPEGGSVFFIRFPSY
jgi:PAS domain S-box-containing protein